ncbi:methyl-CpG-binding domain-containing protein 13 isoform X2 [Macadamia integrifolia]|nr:methyl-CpG-binding domain-containing protein 13 isoform X2 [Macadamia integrifolia]
MEDSPEWLPTGWSMVTKTRKSGMTAGRTYKCYISSTGSKFYSKEEVFRYLKNGKIQSHTSEPNKRDTATHCHSAEPNKIDTATHCHSSKPKKRDAAVHCPTSEQNKRDAAVHSTKSASKVVVEKHTAEGLPPGWIKEIKVTQMAGRTRKDPYYIDPVTGYEFRSLKDVFRYLESGDLGKCATKPKKRQISDMESIDTEISPPTAAKTHKIAGNATRRCLFTGRSSILSKAVVEDELVLESSSVVEKCLSLPFFAVDGETSRTISDHQEFEGIKNVEGKMVVAESMSISASGAGVSQDTQLLEKFHSVEGKNSKLISAAQKSGGLENTEEKIFCAEKGLVSSSEANGFAEKRSSEKPHDADGESTVLISEALESAGLENMEEKMISAEKSPILVPAADIKQPSEKLHSADEKSSEPVSIAQQESEGLENMEHKIANAENGLISAPSAVVSPDKQPLGKSLGKRKTRAQLRTISTQDGKELPLPRRASKRIAGLQAELAPDLENTVEKIICAKKCLVSPPEADVIAEKHSSEKPHDADGESTELISEALESGGLENMEEKMLCAEKGRISAPAADASPEKQPSEKLHSADGKSFEPVSIAQQESEALENMEHKIVNAGNGLISAPSAEVSPEKQPSGSSLGKRKTRAQLRTISTQDGKELPLPRRASKRLAGVEVELTPDLGISERALRMVAKHSVNLEANPAIGVSPNSYNHQAPKEANPLDAAGEVVTTDPLDTAGEVLTTPHASLLNENASKVGENPNQDEAAPEEPAGKFESEKQATDNPGKFDSEKQSTENLGESEKQSSVNPGEPTKKFESQKEYSEKPVDSSVVLPFGDSWPDPCLEFAFKTLTGAIPVDDNLVIGDYLQENLSMPQDQSFTLPDLGLDGFCQTDIMFQFGATEKSAPKQQSPGKPTCTSVGNCGMEASGDSALQQPNGEGGKEC